MINYEYCVYTFCFKEKNIKEIHSFVDFNMDNIIFVDDLILLKKIVFPYSTYTKEELLNFNNKLINDFFENIDTKLNEIVDKKTFRSFVWSIFKLTRKYTNDYNTLSKMVDGLCYIVDKLGIFIFNYIIGDDFEFPQLRYGLISYGGYVVKHPYNNTVIKDFHNTKYSGLIPALVLNGYLDLFNKLKENILDKTYELDNLSEFTIKKFELNIFNHSLMDFKTYRTYIEFLKENFDYELYDYKDLEKELPCDSLYYGYRHSRIEYLDCSNLPLNVNTAKQIYFSKLCDTYYFSSIAGYWYFKSNFSPETLLSWNNEFIRNFIDNFDDKLSQIKDEGTFRRFYDELTDVIGVYTSDYILLSNLIDILERCINEIGIFIFYPIFNNSSCYGVLYNKIVSYTYDYRKKIENIVSIHSFFDTDYCGLLPTLVCNNYIDLYTKLKTNVLDKIETSKCDEKKAKEYKFNSYESLKDDGAYKQYLKYIKDISSQFKK